MDEVLDGTREQVEFMYLYVTPDAFRKVLSLSTCLMCSFTVLQYIMMLSK